MLQWTADRDSTRLDSYLFQNHISPKDFATASRKWWQLKQNKGIFLRFLPFFCRRETGSVGVVAMVSLLFPNQRNLHSSPAKPNLFSPPSSGYDVRARGATGRAGAGASWQCAATCKALQETNRHNKTHQGSVRSSIFPFKVSLHKTSLENTSPLDAREDTQPLWSRNSTKNKNGYIWIIIHCEFDKMDRL